MRNVRAEIEEMVHRETRAWDARDAEALVELFHPDMVWPWPPDSGDHDPATWVFVLGRFHRERWKSCWEELFRTHELIHNNREILKIEVSKESDAALAVVDIDTLWRDVSANSTVIVTQDTSATTGTLLGVTCGTVTSVVNPSVISAKVSGTSFSFSYTTTDIVPCFQYYIIN